MPRDRNCFQERRLVIVVVVVVVVVDVAFTALVLDDFVCAQKVVPSFAWELWW